MSKRSRDLRLRIHAEGLRDHCEKASSFLVKCQIIEPYVEKGVLRGSVCPWEIGRLNTYGFTILEDFHDTHADENAWNANVAAALGRSYLFTEEREFLRRYFVIMDELKKRDSQDSCALPRSATFSRRESWVTAFYAFAYSSLLAFDNASD